jgi:hypothetical protein
VFEIDVEETERRRQQIREINDKLAGRTPKGRPVRYAGTKLIEVSRHNLPVVQHALVQRLKAVSAELNLLARTETRDLTQTERWQLPANLQKLPREELQEQIHPWISLKDTIEGLIADFEEDTDPESPDQPDHACD